MNKNSSWVFTCVLIILAVVCFVLVDKTEKLYNTNEALRQQIEDNEENYKSSLDSLNDTLSDTQVDLNVMTNRYKQVSENYEETHERYITALETVVSLKEKLKGFDLPVYNYTREQVVLLAKCVQCEAGENNEKSQRYIASVILNRVKSGHFKDSIKEVIYEKVNGVPQFSVAYDGSMDKCSLSSKVLANVYSVIVHGKELPDDVLYFYSAKLKSDNWVKSRTVYDTVEGTVFCY